MFQEAFTNWEEFPIALIVQFSDIRLLTRVLSVVFVNQVLEEESEMLSPLSKCMKNEGVNVQIICKIMFLVNMVLETARKTIEVFFPDFTNETVGFEFFSS